jgi:hypothetical protein
MGDIDFTNIPAAGSNIPAGGYDIAELAAKAAAQGEPVVLRYITGITGPDGTWPELVVKATEDGSIVMPAGYEPVIADGKFTGWRDLEPARG